MRRSLICFIVCLVLIGVHSEGLVVTQPLELSCPAILKELYFPASLQVTFTSVNMVGFGKNIVATKPNLPFQYGETATGEPQSQFIVTWMTQNLTDTWTLDLFMNYTTPTPQYVLYSTTMIDSTGIPMMQQDSCYTATDKVWIHFQITTRSAPRPATLSETFGFLLQPGNLLVTAIDTMTGSVQENTGYQKLTLGIVGMNFLFTIVAIAIALSKRGGD